jgi:hypothetical protein
MVCIYKLVLYLVQAWVFHHFPGMGSKDVWEGYLENQYPRAMCFLPLSGLGTIDNYITHLDALDLTRVVMVPYGAHRQASPFQQISLYSGWLRFGERMVRYLSERVLRQFGWVQTIPRHPLEITNRFQHALDYALTPQMLGATAVHYVQAVDGYIDWFYRHSHPCMILPDMPVSVSRPPEREVLDARAAQEDGDLAYLQLSGKMSRIRDHIYDVMRSGLVSKGTEEWQHLEDVLKEMHDGKVYSRQGATEDGTGGGRGGSRGVGRDGSGAGGVVIRG